ncbi:urease accessory protein UreE [Rhodobacteraceae bacterium CCMM004]|nr:urease accessory protein UreE [Rhodobacteraceae bacterium CCMM004]
MQRAERLLRGAGTGDDAIALDHESRFLRRRRLVTRGGRAFLVDLAETVSLDHGDALVLDDGTRIVVEAAPEPLLQVAGDLPRLAWHIGNRHTPCEIGADRLWIRADPVLADMLARLGADTQEVTRPFRPEGGAYGHGRTHGHAHDG